MPWDEQITPANASCSRLRAGLPVLSRTTRALRVRVSDYDRGSRSTVDAARARQLCAHLVLLREDTSVIARWALPTLLEPPT